MRTKMHTQPAQLKTKFLTFIEIYYKGADLNGIR